MVNVLLKCESKKEAASAFAENINSPLLFSENNLHNDSLSVVFNEDGITLEKDNMILRGDFSAMKKRIKKNNLLSEAVIKAAKIKDFENPTLIDATAGLGEDSFLLAAYGFKVTMFEYDPVIALLLSDALERGKKDSEISDIISRMTLIEGDSIEYMKKISPPANVIYLDPMFPRREKSGLIKKKFQLLQKLEMPCTDENELLGAALNVGAKKIIIKRPQKGPFLGEQKPSYSIFGASVRFDVIIPGS